MNMNSPEANNIFTWLALSALPCGMMIERTIHLSLLNTRGMRPYRDTRFTRFFGHGATIFGATLMASLFGLLPSVLHYGVSDLIAFLTAARRELGWLGSALTGLVVLYVAAPFIVGVSVLIGRFRPRPMGLPMI